MLRENKVLVGGALGKDPECKFMPNGDMVAEFSVATDESYKDKQSGQKVELVEWHNVVAYKGRAESVSKYLKKGSKVYIEGKLKTERWEKDGIKRSMTKIIASRIQFLDPLPQQPADHPQQPAQQPVQQNGFQQDGLQQPVQNIGYWNTDGTACQPHVNQAIRAKGIEGWPRGTQAPAPVFMVQGYY